jgi:hypothetical protein
VDCSQLDSLINISKKKESSQAKKDLFSKELVLLYEEEGFSNNFEIYFYEGFSFLGANPIFDYIKTLDEQSISNFLDKLIQCKSSKKNNNGSALKVFIHLFGLFIVYLPGDIKNISLLVSAIPSKARNKSGEIHKQFSSIIDNYFLALLNKDTIFPDYSKLNEISDVHKEFSVLISEALKKLGPKDGSEKEIHDKVFEWVSQKPHTELIKNPKNREKSRILKKTENIRNDNDAPVSQLVERLKSELEITYKKRPRKGLLDYNKISDSRIEADLLKMSQEVLELLQETISNYKKEITELKEQISQQHSVLSAYNSDKQNSLSEQLNIVASKLKSHYLNYKDAISMDMSIELGEALREIIGDVFKTLVKSGVNLEEKEKNV